MENVINTELFCDVENDDVHIESFFWFEPNAITIKIKDKDEVGELNLTYEFDFRKLVIGKCVTILSFDSINECYLSLAAINNSNMFHIDMDLEEEKLTMRNVIFNNRNIYDILKPFIDESYIPRTQENE